MKIKWNKNPAQTLVELDDTDVVKLTDALWNDELNELSYDVVYAKENNTGKLDEAIDRLINFYDDDGITTEIVERHKLFLTEYNHCGDCTCVPASCIKCYTEHLMGIDTIKWFSKHSLYKIDGYFNRNPDATIDDAINYLENDYADSVSVEKPDTWIHFNQTQYDGHRDRWIEEAKIAAKELRQYKLDNNL